MNCHYINQMMSTKARSFNSTQKVMELIVGGFLAVLMLIISVLVKKLVTKFSDFLLIHGSLS